MKNKTKEKFKELNKKYPSEWTEKEMEFMEKHMKTSVSATIRDGCMIMKQH